MLKKKAKFIGIHTPKAEECNRRASFSVTLAQFLHTHATCNAKSWDQRLSNSVTPSAGVQCEGVAIKLGFVIVDMPFAAPRG